MGWCSGAPLAEDVWCLVRGHIPKEKRKAVAKKIVLMFEKLDADTIEWEAPLLFAASGLPCSCGEEDTCGH